MRVAVIQTCRSHQHAVGRQGFNHRLVGIPDTHAGEQLDPAVELAVVTDRIIDRQVVAHADRIILQTMRGRRMHETGTGVRGDMVAANDRHLTRIERMLQCQMLERRPLATRQCQRLLLTVTAKRRLCQRMGQNQQATTGLNQIVIKLRMHTDRLVGRQCPRRRSPDHGIGVIGHRDAKRLAQHSLVHHLETDIDRRRVLVLVLDFGFCQRGTAIHAPMHRFAALIQVAVFVNVAERAHDIGLGAVIHGQVGVIPIAQHAETDEILFLPFHLLCRIGAAQFAELGRRDILAVQFLHHQLDRQAVTVPARHVRRIEAVQRLRLDDDVFQYLVDRMTDVNVAIGIRRAVVQDEFFRALTRLADTLIELFFLPLLQPLRLALGKVAAHGESRVRKIQFVFGVFIVCHVSSLKYWRA